MTPIGTKYTPGKSYEFREPMTGFYQSLMVPATGDMLTLQRALTAKHGKKPTLFQRLMVM